jgi:hypothetical protein
LKNRYEVVNPISNVKRFGIIILAILIIAQGFFIINILPGEFAFGASNEQNSRMSRGKRTIEYNMNQSQPGRHQIETIYGWREVFNSEVPPEQQLINAIVTGDFDGDGLDDIIVSSIEENIFPNDDVGVVYIIYGVPILPATYDMGAHSNLTIIGVNANDGLGSSLAIGNINNDSYDDLIVGAAKSDTVHVFFGGPYIRSLTTPWDLAINTANVTIIGKPLDTFGVSVAIDDLDKDDIDDLIIGAPTSMGKNDAKVDCGEVYIIKGEGNLPETIDFSQPQPPNDVNFSIIYGDDPNDQFGTVVATGGDFDNDTYLDIAVSAPYGDGNDESRNDAGEVYVLYMSNNLTLDWDLDFAGTRANFTIYGNQSFDQLGLNNMIFSDVNNDNIADLIVGAPFAQEKSGFIDTGVGYVFYGSMGYAPEPYEWNLFQPTTKASVTILFPDSFDYAGTWVDSFDWNNDNINDIIITAPGTDQSENITDTGELVIINGSNQIPVRIDLGVKSPGVRVIGAEVDDKLGGIATHAHLDGDIYPDLLVFAEGADGFNNNKLESGEIYVIPGASSLAPQIRSLNLMNGGGPTNTTCYTKLTTYEFEVDIGTPLGFDDLTNVSIVLDPLGLGLRYSWFRAGNLFMEDIDPGEYADLVSTQLNATQGSHSWLLSFNLIFNWSCPYSESELPIFVGLYNEFGYYITRYFPNVFKVESRLNFTGNLMVKEEDTIVLNDNDWVRGGRTIRWSGLTVVYENTTDVYPDPAEYQVILSNLTKNWVAASTPGSEINFTTQTGTSSLALDSYQLNITNIPETLDMSDISFNLRIDVDNIEFSDMAPSSNIWQTQSPVTCEVTATDLGGNQVDASSIEYRTSENNGTIWSDWMSAGLSSDSVSIDVDNQIPFSDGAFKLIQWRGNDTLGNGYTTSTEHRVKVDTENITFSNPTPDYDETMTSLNVTFGIEISDNTSGVNASTIEYSYSTDDGTIWSAWMDLGLSGIKNTIDANKTLEFKLGDDNLVKWRASDAAGNGPTESQVQRINVFIATTELKAYLIRPQNNAEVGNATPKLVWDCNDNSSDIVFDVYFSKTELFVTSYQNPIAIGISDKFITITDTLEDGEIYYWTVVPRNLTGKRGINVNGIWSFKIDLNITEDPEEPVITLVYPGNNQEITTLKPTFKWDLSYINPVGVKFDLHVGTSPTDLNRKVPDLTTSEYVWNEALINHTTYYWRIGVHGGDLQKTYWSTTWQFTTNVKPMIDFYDFRLSSAEKSLTIYQGEEEVITITVKNLKDTEGTVKLTVQSATLDTTNFRFTPDSVDLTAFESKSVLLTVSIPESTTKGDYQFTVIGTMETEADREDVVKDLTFQLTVKAQEDKPPENGGEEDPEDFSLLIVGIAIIVIIIIVIIVVFFLMRKKKGEPEEYPGEVEEPMMPEGMVMAPPMEGMEGSGEPGMDMAPMDMPPEPGAPMAMAAPMEGEMEMEPGMEGMEPVEQEPIPGMEEAPLAAEPTAAPAPMAGEEPMPMPEQEPEAEVEGAVGAPEPVEGVEPEAEAEMPPSDLPADAYQEPAQAPPAAAEPAEPQEPQPEAQGEGEVEKEKPEKKTSDEEGA